MHEYGRHEEQGNLFACKIIAANTQKKLATADNLTQVYPQLKNARKVGCAIVIKEGSINPHA